MRSASIILVAFAAFASCSSDGSEAFCDAAEALATFDHRTADREQINGLVDDLTAAAPDEIEDSAETFGEGIRALMSGDFDKAADPKFREASTEIQRYTEDNCETTNSE